jgi:hypothetical protein
MAFMRGMRTPVTTDLDAALGEDFVEQGGKLPVPIAGQVSERGAGILDVHGEVARGLGRPGDGRGVL